VTKTSLSIVFVTRQRIKALNKKFLGRDYVTDVLAFDLRGDYMPLPKGPKLKKVRTIDGEVIVSTDAVLNNTKAYQTSPAQELILYILHGILHLLGYDDHNSEDIKRMRRKEAELMSFLGTKINSALEPSVNRI